jgi:hypothetical protein
VVFRPRRREIAFSFVGFAVKGVGGIYDRPAAFYPPTK